ncbi:hypothetical protein C8R47DRAFT_1210444 [Mycena vitilis]|nr:hypothetical protein C8R47DRAFT_1210436 [Mycena vitilis]KAJ6503164.1 hypothetical protein C8R47DRAFT_1210439 [Mycena vitilis]KAJ6503169.1 hypothetical protein C8R47DRAFT_1210444 [Mycena vitilis]
MSPSSRPPSPPMTSTSVPEKQEFGTPSKLYYEHRLPLGAVTNRPRFGGATRLDDFEVMALAPQVHRLARPCADPHQTITFLVAFFGDAVPRFLALFSRPGVKVDDVEGASTNVGADVATDIESADSRGPLNGSAVVTASLCSLPPLHESILKTPEPAHDVDIGP